MKEKYIEKRGVFGNSVDYHIYHMKISEILFGVGIGFSVGAIIFYIFFRVVIGALIVGILSGLIGIFAYKNKLKEKRYNILLDQFKELLEALATSYSAGRNSVEAFKDAKNDLSHIYPKDSYIMIEVNAILAGIKNNKSIETMLIDWGERSGLEDIKSFADVFAETERQGGNMSKVIGDARNVINEKIDTEREIAMVTNSAKNEFNIMMCIPFVILLLISSDSSMSIVSNTHINIIIKTIVLIIFAVAYVWARKMLSIKA